MIDNDVVYIIYDIVIDHNELKFYHYKVSNKVNIFVRLGNLKMLGYI